MNISSFIKVDFGFGIRAIFKDIEVSAHYFFSKWHHLLCLRLLFFVAMFITHFLQAQSVETRKCGTPELNHLHHAKFQSIKNKWEKRNTQNFKKSEAFIPLPSLIKIPVVVHVLHNVASGGITGTNISKAQIESQIRVLNEDFRRIQSTNGFNTNEVGVDTEFEFHLATTDPDCNPTDGITRHFVNRNSFDVFANESLIKSYGFWPSDQYLNIWVCSISGGFLGATQFPSNTGIGGLNDFNGDSITDGIIIRHNVFGSRTGTASTGIYSYGRTLTHEIGHWLGLLHTWGDQRCGNDYCNDTPEAEDSNLQSNCNAIFSNCTGTITRNMIENYMDYSPDICMNIFTKDQKARMRKVMENAPRRNALLKSRGLLHNNLSILPYYVNNVRLAENATKQMVETNCGNQLVKITPTTNSTTIYKSSSLINVEYNQRLQVRFNWQSNVTEGLLKIYYLPSVCSDEKMEVKTLPYSTLQNTKFTHPDCRDFQNIVLDFPVSNQKYIQLQIEWESNSTDPIAIGNLQVVPESSAFKVYVVNNPSNLRTSAQFNSDNSTLKVNVDFSGEASDVYFELYDGTGKKLMQRNYFEVYPGVYSLPAQFLPSGVYVLKTIAKDSSYISRVVIY